MRVTEILETVRPAYLDTWPAVFEYFRSTPHEWRRVQELMVEIETRGQQEPGRIDYNEPDEAYPDEERFSFLGNGTHRFAATVELGLEDFMTINGEENELKHGNFYTMTEVSLLLKEHFAAPVELLDDDDVIGNCLDSSLSFRVNEQCWAEMDGMGCHWNRVGREFNLYFLPIPEMYLHDFAKKFLERIACCITGEMIDDFSVGNIVHYESEFWSQDGRKTN